MSTELDVYRDWLGITALNRPLNYYQLLRLSVFEDDPQKIRERYRKMNAHVRKFGTGDYLTQSQTLLNELAKAMLCLTDAVRKRDYDAALGRQDSGSGSRRSLEEILLASKAITPEQLAKARSFAEAVGLEVRDALVQQKLASAEVVTQAFAEAHGYPYLDLAEFAISEELIPQVPGTVARIHSCIPVLVDGQHLLMASPNPLNPDVEEELRLRVGLPVRTVLCTPASINAAIGTYYGRGAESRLAAATAPASAADAAAAAVQSLMPAAAATSGKSSKAEKAAAQAAAQAAKAAEKAAQAAQKVSQKAAAPDPISAQEHRKRRAMVAVTGFTVTCFFYSFYQVWFTDGMQWNLPTLGTMFALAGAGAVVAFLGATMMDV